MTTEKHRPYWATGHSEYPATVHLWRIRGQKQLFTTKDYFWGPHSFIIKPSVAFHDLLAYYVLTNLIASLVKVEQPLPVDYSWKTCLSGQQKITETVFRDGCIMGPNWGDGNPRNTRALFKLVGTGVEIGYTCKPVTDRANRPYWPTGCTHVRLIGGIWVYILLYGHTHVRDIRGTWVYHVVSRALVEFQRTTAMAESAKYQYGMEGTLAYSDTHRKYSSGASSQLPWLTHVFFIIKRYNQFILYQGGLKKWDIAMLSRLRAHLLRSRTDYSLIYLTMPQWCRVISQNDIRRYPI